MRLFRIFILFCLTFSSICLWGQSAKDTTKSEELTVVMIKTSFGQIDFLLYNQTPKHRDNFIKLAKKKFFNGTTFHRCIKGFVVQGGDPNSKDDDPKNDGNGGPKYMNEPGTYPDNDPDGKGSYTIDAEISPDIKHLYGAVGAARAGDDVNPLKRSSGSQFYITIRKGGLPSLDNKYTVFGMVVKGMDVAELIADQPKGANDRPIKNIKMKVKIKVYKKDKFLKKYGDRAFQMK